MCVFVKAKGNLWNENGNFSYRSEDVKAIINHPQCSVYYHRMNFLYFIKNTKPKMYRIIFGGMNDKTGVEVD